MSTIIPVPKKSTPKQLNDFRSVAETSLVMKTLEKIMKSFSLSAVEPMLDPLQLAYRAGRGVDDGKLFLLDKLCNTWSGRSFMLKSSADFSSAFNTTQPPILAQKMISNFSLQHDLVLWIVEFLTNRCRQMFVNIECELSPVLDPECELSPVLDPPRGVSFSPLLCIIYTDDCRSNQENSYLVKFY